MNPRQLNLARRLVVLLVNGMIALGLVMSYAQVRTAQLEDYSRGVPPDQIGIFGYVYIGIPLVAIVLEFLSSRVSWVFNVGWLVVVALGVTIGLAFALAGVDGFREPEHWFALAVTVAIPALLFAGAIHLLFRAVKRAEAAA